jgi:pimeloyl-ACP methyl ester carboxylesterase
MVTLVPGLGCSHRSFARLWRLLSGAQCVEPAGDTISELAAELARLAAPRSLLVANSLGCQVAMELAVASPERVAGLVLLGPTVDPSERRFVPELGRLLSCAFVEPLDLLPLVVRDYARWGVPRLVRVARSMLADPVEERLPQLEQPVVVVRGVRDPICTQAWAEQLASGVRHGRLVVLADAGHAVHWSHPGEVARLVEELQHDIDER